VGRPRKHNPTIPAHIDQSMLPKGVYWDSSGNGRWYVRATGKAVMVAGPKAQLSDLHAIIEQRAGGAERGTVGHYIQRFHASSKFRQLSPRTQSDYKRQADIVSAYITPLGVPLSAILVARLNATGIQRIIDKLDEAGTPTKANHLLRYMRRVFSHAVRHEGLAENPAKGVEQAKERGRTGMPSLSAYGKVLTFARDRAQRDAHTAGSVAPYLPHLMLIANTCRLRGIEVVTLTDAHATGEGVRSNRRKGSRDNVTAWTPALRAAWDALVAIRSAAWERNKRPVPLRAEDRPLIVAQSGSALSKSGLDTSWQRMMTLAVKAETITDAERFTLHGLKHRGITDSADKASGGHRTEAMRQRYDHALPVVEPSRTSEFSGEFSGAAKSGSATD